MINSYDNIFVKIFKCLFIGVFYIFLIPSRGLSFIFFCIFKFLHLIFRFQFLDDIAYKIKYGGENPLFYALIFFIFVVLSVYYYLNYYDGWLNPNNNKHEVVNRNNNNINYDELTKYYEDYALYKKFSSYKETDININELKKINNEIVGWLIVDGTTINYPIVKHNNNDYYINHNIEKKEKLSGWPFLDCNNNVSTLDINTILYGNNINNKTNFGDIKTIFSKKWYKDSNHTITFITESGKYNFQIFSNYYDSNKSQYLQKASSKSSEILDFYNKIKEKSERDYKVKIYQNDKIITLITSSDEQNKNYVVHGKLI